MSETVVGTRGATEGRADARGRGIRVCMLVRNPCVHDSRVLREAKTLAAEGYHLTIIAVNPRGDLPWQEERDGFQIIRVEVNPLSVRLVRWLTAVLSWPSRRLFRGLRRLVVVYPRRALRWLRRQAYRLLRPLAAPLWEALGRLLGAQAEGEGPPLRERSGPWRLLAGLVLLAQALAYGLSLPFRLLAALGRPPARLALAALRQGRRILSRALRAVERRLVGLARRAVMLFHDPLSRWDYGTRCARVLSGQPAHIYHAHDFNTLDVGYFLARRHGAKLVYDSHELALEAGRLAEVRGLQKRLLRAQEGFFIRRCHGVITVNRSIAQILASQYGIDPPVVVMNCPERVQVSGRRSLRALAGVEEGLRIVLYHGGLSPNRGLHQLIEASRWFQGAVLVFMGYGALEGELREIASAPEIARRVRFVDPVPPDEVADMVSTADLGVIPLLPTAKNHYYALPNKFFECLMAGVPVAASNFPEMEAIIREHRVGATFDPSDPRDIARAVNEVLSSDDFPEMRRRAREVAERRYCWDVESRNLLALYASLARDIAVGPGRRISGA